MGRRRMTAEEIASSSKSDSPARQLAAMCRPKAKKRPANRNGPKASTILDQIDKVQEIAANPERWSEMTPAMFVALYAWLHSEVYGVDPSAELAGKTGLAARGAAKRMVDEMFDGDRVAAVDFVRWSWRREKGREQWRRDNGQAGSRMGWRWQFGPALVNDYRVHLRRQRAEGAARELSTRVESP